MKKLSVGQKKFLAEYLGNFSIAWIVGAVISPFFAETLLTFAYLPRIILGIINAGWSLVLGFSITKEVNS